MSDYQIGELAEKYETSNRGPGYISDGDRWDPGGDSYGSYQLATNPGTLIGYLRSGLPYTDTLKQLTPKSEQFNAEWERLAQLDPEGFKQSQFDYVKTLSYDPCRSYADHIGIADTLAINSALFSISNQHGGWKKILDAAGVEQSDTEEEQINKLYDARERYIESLSILPSTLKDTLVKTRCQQERIDCLKLIGEPQSHDTVSSNPKVVPQSKSFLERFILALKAYITKSPK